jgi:hypothetical protein
MMNSSLSRRIVIAQTAIAISVACGPSHTCVEFVEGIIGAACDPSVLSCGVELVCDDETKVYIAPKPEGEPCSSHRDCDSGFCDNSPLSGESDVCQPRFCRI